MYVATDTPDPEQLSADTFYWKHGPCCAGCDHWHRALSSIGECRKAAPVSGADRLALLGIEGHSFPPGAGHPLTKREHHCGDFKDDFDWSTLSPWYLRKIGHPDA